MAGRAGTKRLTKPAAPGIEARDTALEILMRVERQAGFADALLGNRIAKFPPADRRLITRLVLGTIAWQARLDYELAALCSRRLADLDPIVRMVLRLGLFQLRFLTRVPEHAAVDTSVSLARRRAGSEGAARMVNATLRRATREGVALPARESDEIGYLATAWSHPRWLVEKFVGWFGSAAAEQLMAANNEAAPNAIRLNLRRGSREELVAALGADSMESGGVGRFPETLILKGAPHFDSESYRRGLFYAQSEASQIVARMLDPEPGSAVVDCAAAPGGKATHLAELCGPQGRIVALDINLAGLKRARSLAHRLGHKNMSFVRADLSVAAPIRPASCPFVLLDAPCTGLGSLREHPEIRWRLAPDDLARLAALQAKMLEITAELVAPGGAIVYAVCSLAPDEGPEVVRSFLRRRPEVTVERPALSQIEDLLTSEGMLVTRLDRGGLDGFFAVRLRRR